VGMAKKAVTLKLIKKTENNIFKDMKNLIQRVSFGLIIHLKNGMKIKRGSGKCFMRLKIKSWIMLKKY
jgi:hypothetical protein